MSASLRGTRVAIGALGLAVTLLVAGCATNVSGDPASSSAALLPAAEGKTQYPLTVDTEWGEIVIEQRPERIVAGDTGDVDFLAALGVSPVGTDAAIEMKPFVTDLLPAEIETTWDASDVWYPLEPIAGTEPDLIMITTMLDEPDNLADLSRIAPVFGPESAATLPTWQERIRQLGLVLDLSDRAEDVIADNDAFFAGIRAEHPEFAGKTVALLHFWGNQFGVGAYLSTPGSGSEVLFTQMGFDPNPDAARFADVDDFSLELTGSIQADVVVITDASGNEAEFREFVDSPLFQSIDAVAAGRLVELINVDYGDITQDGVVIAEDFGHFGWAINADTGPVPQQALADFFVPVIAASLAG